MLRASVLGIGPDADRERGASAVEYGLLLALIAAIVAAAIAALGLTVEGLFAAGVLP